MSCRCYLTCQEARALTNEVQWGAAVDRMEVWLCHQVHWAALSGLDRVYVRKSDLPSGFPPYTVEGIQMAARLLFPAYRIEDVVDGVVLKW